VIALLGLTAVGCSGSGKKITGSVTLNGQPLADARVEFHPKSNLNIAAAEARTDAQGNFEILPRPRSSEILAPGDYVVFVRKMVDRKGAVPSEEDYGQLLAAGQLVNKVPPVYSDRDFPQLTATIDSNTQTLPPFQLKSR
jgi:hypothetical protein